MIKKQTVWLITMLSLMIVLSVYYMTLDPTDGDFAHIDNNENSQEQETITNIGEQEGDSKAEPSTDLENDATINDITNLGRDELFTTIRLELQNQRSMQKSRYEDIVASGGATVEEKNDALDEIHLLEQIDTQEVILQNRILSTTNAYDDVLVRYRFDDQLINVHVQADELSETEANHIMQMAKDEFGEMPVAVTVE